MRSIALLSVLIGSTLANDPFEGFRSINMDRVNAIRVVDGKVVDMFEGPPGGLKAQQNMMRNTGDGSTQDDNIFTGTISIIDALNPNSPFSQWVDDLLNPESDPYKQAVINALKILLAILISALAPLGITNFTVLILGFAPGSVQVDYEMAIDPVVVAQNNIAAADIGTAVSDEITNNGDQITTADGEVFTMDNGATQVNGGDGTTITSSCPTCWTVIDGACVPDPSKLTLSCNADGMSVAVDHCVMGETDISALSLSDSSCNAGSNSIIDTGSQYIASTSLDGCSTEMTFVNDKIHFSNKLVGDFDTSSSIISLYNRYQIDFLCEYASHYEDINADTEVTSLLVSGPTNSTGDLSFSLNTYTDATFNGLDNSGSIQVGSTLYFGIEISQQIAGIVYSVTDCTVKNEDLTLEYQIFTNRCPNTRVHFHVYDNYDSALTSFGYTVFEFKANPGGILHLSCNIVVCDATDSSSTCQSPVSCSRRRRRSVELIEGQTYYRVSRNIRT